MVQGLDALKRRWAAIPKAAWINVRAAMEDQADKIVEEIWSRAPQGETGRVGASIGWTWGDPPNGTKAIASVGNQDPDAMRITIYAGGDEAFYARFHEFGTVNMPARPFFYPVWRARKKRARSAITRAISKAIRES